MGIFRFLCDCRGYVLVSNFPWVSRASQAGSEFDWKDICSICGYRYRSNCDRKATTSYPPLGKTDPNPDCHAVLACSNSTQHMMVFLDAVTTRPGLHHLRGQIQDTGCRVSRGYASRMDVGNKVPICIGVTFTGTIGHIR